MENTIGYVLIDKFATKKKKVCEAPKHKGMNLAAYAVLVTQGSMYPDGLVQMVCFDCWKQFDNDMGNPKWCLTNEIQ